MIGQLANIFTWDFGHLDMSSSPKCTKRIVANFTICILPSDILVYIFMLGIFASENIMNGSQIVR